MAKAKAAILAEPKGLNVAVVTELRRKLREAKVEYRIVKNTLAARAAKGTPVESIAEKFVGPTALVMSYDDVVTPAKLLADFMKDRENFTIRTAVIEGKVVDAKGVQSLAKLPGLQELRGQIAAMIAQPATQLARMIGPRASSWPVSSARAASSSRSSLKRYVNRSRGDARAQTLRASGRTPRVEKEEGNGRSRTRSWISSPASR